MANGEQLAILRQGVEVWNRWRKENPNVGIQLVNANLANANLAGANLTRANLWGADLTGAELMGAALNITHLWSAKLNSANLRLATLMGADLSQSKITRANLQGANLRGANLRNADLTGSNIKKAHLTRSNLFGANLQETHLNGSILDHSKLDLAIFSSANISDTSFIGVNLKEAIGLDTVRHQGPSILATNTLALSQGQIPNTFLRGCGLMDWEIEATKLYNPYLRNDERNTILYKIYDSQCNQAIQISPLFISYCHEDIEFVNKIDKSLVNKGIRFWRDIHDMKAGRIEKQIDQAISQNRTALIVLSENSLKSDWVEHEVRRAREFEKDVKRDILCPIALDDSWKDSRWPRRIIDQVMEYNILDFSAWEDDVKFEGMFRKLIDGLELFYKG